MNEPNMDSPASVTPEVVLPTAPPKPRLWPALTVGFGVIPLNLVLSIVVILGSGLATGQLQKLKADEFTEWLTKFASASPGFFIVILPSQLLFLGAALLGARLSPQPAKQRLGFVKSRLPVWSWPVLMVATPFFTALLAGVAMLAMKGESDQVKLLQEMAHAPSGAFAVVSTMVLGLVAPIVEEMLFRGYVQRRLLERWPPAVAIAVSTLMFGAAHLDPGEGLMAAVIGVWLGIVAWRCGSIWPSIACHATQNLLFVAANRLGDADDSGDADTRPLLILLGVFAAFFVAAIWLMWRYGKKREEFDAEKDAK